MPIHDWRRVIAGTFHHFHQTWIIEISRALNAGRLPGGFYAMAEQIAGGWGPDVLALEGPADFDYGNVSDLGGTSSNAAVAVVDRPPRMSYHTVAEVDEYAVRATRVSIRHSSNHRVVAMIEIVSPGNKRTARACNQFVEKANEMLDAGIHLMVIDLFPPGNFDPGSMHAAIWTDRSDTAFTLPADKPLTLSSYIGARSYEAYVEPTAIGTLLIDMPLFLDSRRYVPVPLEPTYQSAWEAVPAIWRREIERV